MTKSVKNKKFYEFWIALRYTNLKNTNQFISFISLTSIIGITLGVMALIIVLSVMNGFQSELKSRILSVTSHIEITKPGRDLNNWQQTKKAINKDMGIDGVSPYVEDQAMISVGKRNRGVIVRGIFPEIEKDVNDINTKISSGAYRLNEGQYDILIGVDLSRYLGVSVGDKIAMISSKSNFSAAGIMPRIKRFNISGIFDSGMYEYDAGLALINLKDAQTFFKKNKNVSGLRIELNNIDDTEKISSYLKKTFSDDPFVYVSDWRIQHANLFAAIELEKKVMFIILTLIIAVAAFNIVSTLVMGVTEKRSDIAILRTIGVNQKSIMYIFILQGFIIGALGTFFGIFFGVAISLNIEIIVPFIESVFNTEFLAKDIYLISTVPSKVMPVDVYRIGLMGLFLSLVAAIYPSYKASKTDPATALKYE
jgi:lipoprotein-releasing system permease protein